MRILSNNNSRLDFFGKRLTDVSSGEQVSIASAFFSNSEYLQKVSDSGGTVSLVIRLNEGTNPDEVLKALKVKNVFIRFYTSTRFHPKLYLVGNTRAFIGSSNLTKSGFGLNQELNVEIADDEFDLESFRPFFFEYWEGASVLTLDIAKKFKEAHDEIASKNVQLDRVVLERIGNVEPQNIDLGYKISANSQFLERFRKQYQLYIAAFDNLKEIYLEVSPDRKYPSVPLRIEVDRFLWWLRESCYSGEEYKNRPILARTKIFELVQTYKPQYVSATNEYLDGVVLNYQKSLSAFSSAAAIESIPLDDLYAGLLNIHAFFDRFRFFEGGRPTMKREFLRGNSEAQIRKSINHIIFGAEEYPKRIFEAIYSPEYRLENFGESCVKELFGMVNQEDVPICNGRTLKSLEWLGFGKL